MRTVMAFRRMQEAVEAHQRPHVHAVGRHQGAVSGTVRRCRPNSSAAWWPRMVRRCAGRSPRSCSGKGRPDGPIWLDEGQTVPAKTAGAICVAIAIVDRSEWV